MLERTLLKRKCVESAEENTQEYVKEGGWMGWSRGHTRQPRAERDTGPESLGMRKDQTQGKPGRVQSRSNSKYKVLKLE